MRVNPDLNSTMLAGLNRLDEAANTVLKQLSSGRKIQKPSDDPAGLASLVSVQASEAASSQYLGAIKSIRSQLQAADSTLNSAMTTIERALSLGVRGATGTMTGSDRQSVAAELDGIGDQLLELANSSIQGIYLFSGTATTTEPFVKAGNSVTYQGSLTTNDVAIGEGYFVKAGLAGSEIFGDGTSGIFASINALATAIRTGNGVTEAIAALRGSRDQLSTARVTYGNSLNQIDAFEQVMNERRLQLAQQETDIAGVDLADVATRLASVQTSREALLATIGKTAGSNLFDYLR